MPIHSHNWGSCLSNDDMFGHKSLGDRITLQFLPILLIMGFIVSVCGKIGLNSYISVLLAFFLFSAWSLISIREYKFIKTDTRFLLVPSFILVIGVFSPYWQFLQFSDQMAHLQISNQLIGRWDWEPWHYGLDFAYRPSIIPGLAAIELILTGEQSQVIITPFFLLTGCCWAIQHLSERWTNKGIGWIGCFVFLLTPGVIIHGRTILNDAAASGMLIIIIMHLLNSSDKPSKESMAYLGLITAIVGLAKYSFLYLGFWILLILCLLKKTINLRYYICASLIIYLPFFVFNLINHKNAISPLEPQIEGTIRSLNEDEINYGFSGFINDFFDQFEIISVILLIIGFIYLYSINKRELLLSWLIVFPLIFLHGLILDFGWSRYHMPWVALCSAIIPCSIVANFHSNKSKIRIPTFAIFSVIFLTLSATISTSNLIENQAYVEQKRDYHLSRDGMYEDISSELSDSSVVLAVNEIQFGLISGIQTFKYGNSNNPIFDSIIVVDADYIVTHEVGNRTQFERNWTYLLGSPIEPLRYTSSGVRIGAMIWEVNETRVKDHLWWQNNSWNVEGEAAYYSDRLILEPNSLTSSPNGSSISRILSIQTNANLRDILLFDLEEIYTVVEICNSIEACSSIDRNLHLNERWVVTGVRV